MNRDERTRFLFVHRRLFAPPLSGPADRCCERPSLPAARGVYCLIDPGLAWFTRLCVPLGRLPIRSTRRAFGVGRRLEIGAARRDSNQVTLNVPVTKGCTVQ